MSKISRPRFGSLQYWPRKRADKFIPRVNWDPVIQKNSNSEGLMGFLSYKVGMASAVVKDDTDKSMTKGKKKVIPVTIMEVPKMKIYSVRLYKKGKVLKDILVSNDKILKKNVRVPKELGKLENLPEFDDVRVIIYSLMGKGRHKKAADFTEVAVNGTNKIETVRNLVGKEISLAEVLKWHLVDVRGLTTGKGLQGPVKRFGITLKAHKSEKGVRRPGSLGPWHPARVTYRTPMAGQLGMFTRVHYNLKVIGNGNTSEEAGNIDKSRGFKNYGLIRGDYIILSGSVQGPVKRQILITPSMRPTKLKSKQKLELLELK